MEEGEGPGKDLSRNLCKDIDVIVGLLSIIFTLWFSGFIRPL